MQNDKIEQPRNIPMICPDCNMIYHRCEEERNDACDFCHNTNIYETTIEEILKVVDKMFSNDDYYTRIIRDTGLNLT